MDDNDDDDNDSAGRRLVLDALADRLGVSPWAVVVGALAIVAAAAGGWWALAAPDPPPPEEVLPRPDAVAPLVDPPTSTAAAVLVVHVDGAVVVPGVHEVAPGARVVDAVAAAGGLTEEADRSRLNLAQSLADGQRIWVPAGGEDEPVLLQPDGGPIGVDGDPGSAGLVDLNQATEAELESLPGVGPTIAAAIVEHREQQGPFATADDLLDVPGIGPAKLAQLAALVTV